MTIKDTFTPMADHLRNEYGVDGLLTTDQIKSGIDGLHVHNYLDAGQVFEKTIVKSGDWLNQSLTGLTVDIWNKEIAGKTVTISADAEWSGYVPGAPGDRCFVEAQTTLTDGTQRWNGVYFTPTTASGKKHISATWAIDKLAATKIDDVVAYDELNTGSHLKLSNIKFVVNPMVGG